MPSYPRHAGCCPKLPDGRAHTGLISPAEQSGDAGSKDERPRSLDSIAKLLHGLHQETRPPAAWGASSVNTLWPSVPQCSTCLTLTPGWLPQCTLHMQCKPPVQLWGSEERTKEQLRALPPGEVNESGFVDGKKASDLGSPPSQHTQEAKGLEQAHAQKGPERAL